MTWDRTVTTTSLVIGLLIACTLSIGCMLISVSNDRTSREIDRTIKFYCEEIRIGQDVDSVASFLEDVGHANFTYDIDDNKIYFTHAIGNNINAIIYSKVCGEIWFANGCVSKLHVYQCFSGP